MDGNLYGTAGSASDPLVAGTVFKITPSGTFSTIFPFNCTPDTCPFGGDPAAALIQGTNGDLYGTTYGGGAKKGLGTVFKITPAGKLTTLHSFQGGAEGSILEGALVQAADGNLYGTTLTGGISSFPDCLELPPIGCGTIFKISTNGKFTTLHSFCALSNCADGGSPEAGLLQGTDGSLYGTTGSYGLSNSGTIFKLTLGGTFSTLHNFDGIDGGQPVAKLIQATNGDFYGTAVDGGKDNLYGTVFALSAGLRPFVSLQPKSGRVGTRVIVRGNNLAGTSAVAFGATPAAFAVVSDTEIIATVPAGSSKGKVEVHSASGPLTSNIEFRVIPTILDFSPSSGSLGTSVTIRGKTLENAGWVSFGGVPASSFTVNSYTEITATVPAGAKTGDIAVTTPSGTGRSGAGFTVTP